MATIPVYANPRVNQAPTADTRLGLRAGPGDFGAGLAEGVGALGRAAGAVAGVADNLAAAQERIAAQERERHDTGEITKAVAKATSTANDLSLEYERHKLDDATKQAPSFEERYGKALDEIGSSLATETQKQAFERWRAGNQVQFADSVRRRAFAEGERALDINDQTAKAEIKRSIAIFADPTKGADGLAQIQDRLDTLAQINTGTAKRKGLDDAALRELDFADLADAHATVIATWNDAGYSLRAKAYFDEHKDELDPRARELLAKALDIGTTKAIAQQKAGEIYSPEKTIEDMFGEADQIEDQGVQAEVKRRLEERDTLRRRAVQQTEDKAFESAYQKVKDDPRGFDVLSPSERTAMGAEREERLKAWTLRRAKGEALPWQQSKGKRYEIEAMLADPNKRKAILDRGPAVFLGTMNEDDQNAVADLIANARKGGASETDWLNSREDVINQTLASMDLDPRPVYQENGQTVYNEPAVRFREAIQAELAPMLRPGEKPTNEQIRKAADAVRIKKVWLNEWGTDPEVSAFQVTKDRRGAAYVPIDKIPANYHSGLRAEILAKTGKAATDDQVQRAYAASLMGDRALYDSIIAGK